MEDLDFTPPESPDSPPDLSPADLSHPDLSHPDLSHDPSNGNSRYSTGPTSTRGKSASSHNSTKHGCRSRIVIILPGERQQDYDQLYERWMAAYEPEDDATAELVEQLIVNKWLLQRNLRRYMSIEEKLSQTDYVDWTEEQHKELQLTRRYKVAAERDASRSQRDLEFHKKCRKEEQQDLYDIREDLHDLRFRFADDLRKGDALMEKKVTQATRANVDISEEIEGLTTIQKQSRESLIGINKKLADLDVPKPRSKTVFQGQFHPKKLRKIAILEQWIEITVQDGQTKTQLFPSNEKLIKAGQAMDPPPEMVYRRMNFVNGIPPEYHWATENEDRRQRGAAGIQRMMIDTWLDVIDAEKADPSGHIGPCGGNLPRPKERGGCDCEVCTYNRAILEREESEGTDDSVPNSGS